MYSSSVWCVRVAFPAGCRDEAGAQAADDGVVGGDGGSVRRLHPARNEGSYIHTTHTHVLKPLTRAY